MGKSFKQWFILGFAFVVITFAEKYSRTLARKPIPIVVADNLNAKVTGFVQPDFLWSGEAWYVRIICLKPLSVDFDGKWRAIVPAGDHVIYHNHDSTNTTEYGELWYKAPAVVTTKSL